MNQTLARAAIIAAAVNDYVDSGDPVKTVAARHNIGKSSLHEAVKKAGVARHRGPSHDPALVAAVLADFRAGMTFNSLAAKHGVSRHVIRGVLDRDASTDNPDELMGGRWVRDGLVMRWQYDTEVTPRSLVRCSACRHVHDRLKVEVVSRYSDCSMWRCPRCDVLIDDRPGSTFPVTQGDDAA